MTARRALLVANPAAGGLRDGEDWVNTVLALVRGCGWEAELARSEVRGHAVLLATEAADAGLDAVVAVGGDGTVREVAAALAERPTALAIAPLGRGNSSHRELYGEAPWEETLGAALAGGQSRAVDLIRLDPTGEISLLGFSVGWFAQVVALAGRPGAGTYAEVAQDAAADPVHFEARVTLDGRVLAEGALGLVAAGGARVRGRVFPVFPESVMDDGLLDVVTVAAAAPARFLELLGAVLQRRHGEAPEVELARGRELVITSGRPLPAEVDGDLWERDVAEVRLSVLEGALRVLAPGGGTGPGRA
jgi:diacylglycerol kinase family enzyme